MNDLKISPAKKYDAPKYPTYESAQNNPVLLNKLPSRWRRKKAVVICAGLIGTITLSGCINSCLPDLTSQGGAMPAEFYVPYLTEQEALARIPAEDTKIIRSLLNTGQEAGSHESDAASDE